MNGYLLSVMKGQRKDFMAQVITCLLLPFSFIYGLAVLAHCNLYKLKGAYKAHKPVVSIGNITVGGAGKTPLVIWLVKALQEKGLKVVILTRGYMPQGMKASDEASMLNEQLPTVPVLVGKDRISSIHQSKDTLPADVYVCDDAFQHWPLGRDLNIVVIDAVNPFGNGYLLPAGILREPLSALKRAHVLVLTKINGLSNTQTLISKLNRINPQALIVESHYKTAGLVDVFDAKVLPIDSLKGQLVIGFCAIGDPSSFELILKDSQAKVSKMFTFMDHHAYKNEDIEHVIEYARLQEVRLLVTTHKDAVKLRVLKDLFVGLQLVYVPIQLEITKGSDELIQKVTAICSH